MISPSKKNFILQTRARLYHFFMRDTDNKSLNFHHHCVRGENEEIHVTNIVLVTFMEGRRLPLK